MATIEPPTENTDAAAVFTADFSQTLGLLFSAGSVSDTLARVAQVAVATIEGCDSAGIFWMVGGTVDGTVAAPVHTDPIATEVEALQHRTGEGPSLEAIAQGVVVYASDLENDPRWPRFGPAATGVGMRSLLALPLLADGTVGALNLYARYPEAFGVIDRARGLLLGAVAALAFSTARTHENEERRTANLRVALATREMIGQAQGILMERERITADEAFDVLRRASQHLNLKLREVAQALVETGERPDTGPSRAR